MAASRAPGSWYAVANVQDVPSPALLLYPDRIEANLRQMLAIAQGPDRLRPHVKTHKLPEVVRRHLAHGITRFKCATLAEVEMVARCGARDVLLAYQPVGPAVRHLRRLADRYPSTVISALVDDEHVAAAIGAEFHGAGRTIDLLVDLDVGMHRSGIAPGDAAALYTALARLPGVRPGGLHAYDGHIRDRDLGARCAASDAAFQPVVALAADLLGRALPVPRLVAGGTPTFPVHARRQGVELSPGTCVLSDAGYGTGLPDLPFQPAALVLTRVVSRPGGNRVCLDLGHKAIASEGPHPRVLLLDVPDAVAVTHSEEHLVIETTAAARLSPGDCLYGVPWHICPTVALHAEAVVVEGGRAVGTWRVTARDRTLSV